VSVTVIPAPNLKNFTKKAAERLQQNNGFDGLFLPFSKELREFLVQFGEGLPYEYLINQLRKSELISTPFNNWEYSAEPILRALPTIKKVHLGLELYCYGDPFFSNNYPEILNEIVILSLKSSLTERVDAEEWRKVLQKEKEQKKQAIRRETEFIAIKASNHQESICLSGSHSREMASELREEGYEVIIEYLQPYSLTPLGILRQESKKEISDTRIQELVLLHLKYVKEYVLRSHNLDEAYQRWRQRKKVK
jgi:hypothetical protein